MLNDYTNFFSCGLLVCIYVKIPQELRNIPLIGTTIDDTLTTENLRYSVRVSPQMANRLVESARSILNQLLPDIYIYTDHMKGANSGK